ncbi:MAG TPA: hypothetical protein VHY31_16155 [Streptosporangiaceae bacterium]|nr:hypothetical protein [Streptosporangiaceae bacterium]
MRAVDDPRPDGLGWDDLVAALRTAIGSGHAVGLQVAIYNPDFDAGGEQGRGLDSALREALAG